MTAFVSLFRGINVGGNHQVKMDALKELHQSLGLQDVSTYIQSGNVVFSSDTTDPAQLQKQIESGFAEKSGFRSEVFIRSSAELQEVIEKNPFQDDQSKESKWVVVVFLAARPDDTAWESLIKSYSGPEQLHMVGRELYIYYPEGMGCSKLTLSLMEKKLKTFGTARNWNTVLKLQSMMSSLE